MNMRLYNTLWWIIQPLVRLQLRRRVNTGKEDRARVNERLGRCYQNQRPQGRLIWLHAVSVGESVAAVSLVRALKRLDNELRFLITTNTITAAKRIEAAPADLSIQHAYQPLDHPKWVKSFLQFWQPNAAIFLESDFWPNLISETSAADIPVYFASAQISERAYQRWQKRPALAAKTFGAANKIFVVDSEQAMAFKMLSGKSSTNLSEPDSSEQISIVGSLKLDLDQLTPNPAYVKALDGWKSRTDQTILLFASSHEGEEALLMNCLGKLSEADRPLLIIAPRHPDRSDKIAQTFSCEKRLSQNRFPDSTDRIFLADTIGDMGSLFAASDIILLGGSFIDIGGHNPMEPASFAKPILSGPSHFKNKAAFDTLQNAGGLRLLKNIDELPAALKNWQSATARQAAGDHAKQIVEQLQQAPRYVAQAIIADLQAQERW